MVPGPVAEAAIADGRLCTVLEDTGAVTVGVFLYYPSKRQVLPKLRVFIDHVKLVS